MRFYICSLFLFCLSACTYVGEKTTPDSDLGAGEGLAVAYAIESEGDGRVAGWGRGGSMEPVFGDNTILVTNPIDFDELEKGMMVAYFDNRERRVVHRLVQYRERGDFWIAKGISNPQGDGARVTRDNLIGVVYATIQTEKEEE